MTPSKGQSTLQVPLNRLNYSACGFGRIFTDLNCTVLLQEWIGSEPKIVSSREQLEEMGRFGYLGS